jgi:hypothetical protein
MLKNIGQMTYGRTTETPARWCSYLPKTDFAELTQESFAVPDYVSHLAKATLYSESRVSSRAFPFLP